MKLHKNFINILIKKNTNLFKCQFGNYTKLFKNQTLVTKQAPNFSADSVMPNKEFKKLSLNDFKNKYLVVFFYPLGKFINYFFLDFTFVCPTELVAFNDYHSQFQKLDCEVVGVSVDSKFSHLAWIKQSKKDGGLGGIC
jgi:peroxiredoxin (alkyl hydroperoxide reductase subunit C)